MALLQQGGEFEILHLAEYLYLTNKKQKGGKVNNEERFLSAIFGKPVTLAHFIEQELLAKEIQDVLETLGKKPKRVINLRFGLEDGELRTLKQVGRCCGLTENRISQIINRSLYRLRHPTRSRRLKKLISPEDM